MKARLLRCYRRLLARFGPERSGTRRTPFEITVAVILAPPGVESNAMAALRRARTLAPRRLARMSERQIAALARTAGVDRAKVRQLKTFTRWLVARHGRRFDTLRRAPLAFARRELLALAGLAPETADAILLYAANRPVFVADAAARRALARHGFRGARGSYDDARRFLEAHLPSDPALFRDFHRLLVKSGAPHLEGTRR